MLDTSPGAVRQRLASDFNTMERDQPSSGKASDVQVGGDHYRNFPIQPAYFSSANRLPFLEGSVIKRVCRHSTAKGAQDIRKAIHELQLILEFTYGEAP